MRTLFLILFALAAPLPSQQPSQQPEITTNTSATPAQIHEWLHSPDPSLIAWAGYFARQTHDTAALAEIPKLLEAWPDAPALTRQSHFDHNRAQASLLSALIETNTDVPLSTLTAIAPTYPIQAEILATRKPLTETSQLLEQWFHYPGGEWQAPTIARIAAMLLAKSPPPRFAASIVADAEEHLTIFVHTQPGEGSLYGEGAGCGEGVGTGAPKDWPPITLYTPEENNPSATGPVLVQLGDDRITYARHSFYGAFGSCHGVAPLNPITRHRLIAYWLSTDPADMPWHPQSSENLL